MLTLNPDDLSQIPQIYKWKEQADSLELSSDLHTHAVAHGCAYTHTHKIHECVLVSNNK